MAKIPALHGYFGGKNKFQNFIAPAAPRYYKIYLEPFAGSFAVYFFLDTPKDVKIIYNDINQDQTNLVACSKDYEVFYKFLKNEIDNPNGSLYCKETDEKLIKEHYKNLYYSFKNSDFRYQKFNIPDMKRASQYAFLLTSAFSSCSYTAAGFSGFKLKTFLNKLKNEGLQNKLSKITSFETSDFEKIIKKYDSPDTFIYLDPPYNTVEKKSMNADTRSGWYGTKDEFGQAEHAKLLELLKTLKSKWMLSYYYFDELGKQLPKDQYFWLEKEFFRSSASFSENKNVKGNELLILNYNPNSIISNTNQSEKLVDEIEEKNDGGFIIPVGDDEIKISNLGRVVVEPPKVKQNQEHVELAKEAAKSLPHIVYVDPDLPKKEEDIDDFWNS